MRTIPDAYKTDCLRVPKEGFFVGQNALHYLTVVELEDVQLLVPTQGTIVHLGQVVPEGNPMDIWAYLRFHRRPFYVYRAVGIEGTVYVDTINPDLVPDSMRDHAQQLAITKEVFDRRHVRVDEDFPTPGSPQDHDLIMAHLMKTIV